VVKILYGGFATLQFLGFVLNIEFCNVIRGGSHISLIFLLLLYSLANELKILFWFWVQEFAHVQSCFFQLCLLNLGNNCFKICLNFLKLYVMAFVCASLCIENQVQLVEMVCTIALDEVDLLQFNPPTDFVL
jgi:hypothetical protein